VGEFALDARQADLDPSLKKEAAIVSAQVYLDIDSEVKREVHLRPARDDLDRRYEAARPAGRK